MKKLLCIFLVVFLWNQAATAQAPVRTYLAMQGEYKLDSVPSVEANDTIGIHLMIDNIAISEYKHTALPPGTPADQALLPEQLEEFPWKIENWKILEGGGTLAPDADGTKRLYTAPAQAPLNDLITVSVDLIPKRTGYPKIVLLKTVYFTENETAVYLNLPEIGANYSKYTVKKNAGVKVPTMQGMDPRVAARMSPEVRKQMEEAQKKVAEAQQSSGIDLSAATSNAMALYDDKNNLTAVKITTLGLQYNNRRTAPPSVGKAMLEFSFKGKGVGKYSLNDEATGLTFIPNFPSTAGGVGCGKNNGRSDAICNGEVEITRMDDKVIKGLVKANVYTSSADGKTLLHGVLIGKFTINRAN